MAHSPGLGGIPWAPPIPWALPVPVPWAPPEVPTAKGFRKIPRFSKAPRTAPAADWGGDPALPKLGLAKRFGFTAEAPGFPKLPGPLQLPVPGSPGNLLTGTMGGNCGK